MSAVQKAQIAPAPVAGSMRTGDDYLRSLADGRAVYIDGERVRDVTKHPMLRQAALSAAKLYDIAADPAMEERMTYVSPTTGNRVLRAFQIPRSHADLKAKRLASETWSEVSFGMMGRTPDHVSGFFAGYAAVPEVFEAGGKQFAENVVAYYEHLRENHLWATYAIVPPQIDRSSPRISRATRRSMPAWSRKRTAGSSSPVRSNSPRPGSIRTFFISAAFIRCSRATRITRSAWRSR